MLLSACYATGPRFGEAPAPPQGSGDSIVYFYRQPGSLGAWVPAGIFVDGARRKWLGQNGYTWMQLPPGAHVVGASWGDTEPQLSMKVRLLPGTHYFRLSTRDVQGGSEIIIEEVEESVALHGLKEFRYSPHEAR